VNSALRIGILGVKKKGSEPRDVVHNWRVSQQYLFIAREGDTGGIWQSVIWCLREVERIVVR